MPYTIKITKSERVTRKTGKEWKVVGQEPDPSGKYMGDKYGYTPEIDREFTEETDVLKQTVEDLDLAAVIKAINKI
jgi:hypothetical protein